VGAAAEVLDPAALRALGISADAGFRVADGGGVLRPQAWRQDALAAAQRAGVQLVRTPVRWVEETLDGLKVSVSGAEVRCEVVVIAHGAAVARWSGWLADKLMPVREQALVAPGSAPVGRAGHGWTSFRPWGADQIAVAGCRWATPHLEVGEIEPTPNRAVQGRLEDFARTRLGVQGALGVRWAWIEDHSCDQLPIVGPLPGSARWVACVGMGANEWSLGRAAGRMVVDGLVGDARSTPSMFSPGRFVG
jgi:glycine/D-amino acid oxidase-like deaminating enzyme